MTQPGPQWWQPEGQQGPPSGPIPQPSAPPYQGQTPQPSTFGGSFSSSYGGFGAFDTEPPGSDGKKSRTPWIVGAVALVLLAGGGAVAWFSGAFTKDVLDSEALRDGIATVLRDSYGEQSVGNVNCPEDQQITAGHTFDCTVDVAGKPKTVSIRVLNDKPQYEVGAPH